MTGNTLYDAAERIRGAHRRFGYVIERAEHLLGCVEHYRDVDFDNPLAESAEMYWDMINELKPSPQETVAELRRHEEGNPHVTKIREDLEATLSALERLATSRVEIEVV